MKKIVCILLLVTMLLSLCSCSADFWSFLPWVTVETTQVSMDASMDSSAETANRLVKVIVKIASERFYNSPAVRVLEIGDASYSYSALHGSSATYVVRLQGKNADGHTVSRCYRIYLIEEPKVIGYPAISTTVSDAVYITPDTWEPKKTREMDEWEDTETCEGSDEWARSDPEESSGTIISTVPTHKDGDYEELPEDYQISDTTQEFSLSPNSLNSAIARFWENAGIN